MRIESITSNIKRVIDSAISDTIERGCPGTLIYDIEHELMRQADRTFLGVTLVLQLREETVESGPSRSELHRILDNQNIETVYLELLETRKVTLKTRKMLSIIICYESNDYFSSERRHCHWTRS